MAALVAPQGRKQVSFPGKRGTISCKACRQGLLGKKVGKQPAAAARLATWLPTGRQPGGSSFVLFIYLLFIFQIKDPSRPR